MEFDKRFDEYGLSTDYEGRCGNCHEILKEDDRYCRYCGTKRGEGAFKPYDDIMQTIYGSCPQKRHHVCESCGYERDTMRMVDNEKYCPKCGWVCRISELS